ncbi:MAG: universal stress protein [Pirellulales bacterium]|nr:universal stress protein [Pirellulales bacterium]
MQINTIVFPTDFSTCSDAGLDYAAALARDTGATLLIVHVEEHPVAYGVGEMYYGALEPDRKSLQAMLEKVVPTNPSVKFEHHLLSGEPADAITSFARERNANLIVMSTHGRTGVMRLLMGSIAESVIRGAECPVLTLREPQATPAKQSGD